MRKIIASVLSLAMVMTMAVTQGPEVKKAEAASKTTIAALTYTYSSSADCESGSVDLNKSKYGSKKNGYNFTTGSAKLYASINGSSLRKLEWSEENDVVDAGYKYNGSKYAMPVMTASDKFQWTANTTPYFEVDLSTTGYTGVTFSAYVGASKKGPKNYAISYAVGSSTSFTKISGATLTLTDNKNMSKISATLPSAADNQSTVKIRIEITNMNAVGGTLLTTNPTKGEAAINYITIKGTKSSTSSSSTAKVTKVKLNKKKLTIKKGKTAKLKATVKATTTALAKTAKKKLKWTSSNKKIATVTKKGKIKAKKKGTVTITVKYTKKLKAKCKVTVK